MTSGASNSRHGGAAGVLSDPQQAAGGGMQPQGIDQDKNDQKVDPNEEPLVKKLWRTYDLARKFDENFRKQVAIDRRYAAGRIFPGLKMFCGSSACLTARCCPRPKARRPTQPARISTPIVRRTSSGLWTRSSTTRTWAPSFVANLFRGW